MTGGMKNYLSSLVLILATLSVGFAREPEVQLTADVYVLEADRTPIQDVTTEVWHQGSDSDKWDRIQVVFTDSLGFAEVKFAGPGSYRIEFALDGFVSTTLGPFRIADWARVPQRLEVVMNTTIHY